jgi:hypothetical protein
MSDSPSIIRQEIQHSVTVTEGSQVASSKPSDPHSPQVRQNLVGEERMDAVQEPDPAQAVPPPLTAAAPEPAQVFERSMTAPEPPAQEVPLAAQAPTAGDAPVFERSLQDSAAEAVLPPALAPLSSDSESAVDRFLRERRLAEPADPQGTPSHADGPVFERSMQDRLAALPEQATPAADPADGPVFERAMQDRMIALPETPLGAESADGPVFERAMQDRMIALPETPPAFAAPTAPAPLKQAPREGSSPGPAAVRKEPVLAAPEPIELAQAQQIIAETAREVQTRVEEAIGAADGQWAEMDFPARVVKLKIENDKVRAKLDELEDLADRQAR